MSSIKEVIGYLYKLKSPILVICDLYGVKGYVKTKDVIALMNLGFEDSKSIVSESKIYELSHIFEENLDGVFSFPILYIEDMSIDFMSKKELTFLSSKETSLLDLDFESIVRNLPLPLGITDRFNRIMWVNLGFLNLFSLSEEDLMGQEITTLFTRVDNGIIVKGKKYRLVISEIIAFDVKVKVFIFIL